MATTRRVAVAHLPSLLGEVRVSQIGAFLVVLHEGQDSETVEATIAATRQLVGVAGIRTFYDDVGQEIRGIRQIREDVRLELLDRARVAGSL